MRRSPRSFAFGPAILAAFLAFVPVTGVLAEDGEFDAAGTDDSQIVPAGAAEDPQPTGKNLNTIPEDGLDPVNGTGPDNLLVRQLLAARSKEDIVICVAGCFSGRDRVVYAQPAERLARVPVAAPQSSLSVAPQNISSIQPADGAAKPSKAASAEPQVRSQDPTAPAILNRSN
jgi:hypothetical protein